MHSEVDERILIVLNSLADSKGNSKLASGGAASRGGELRFGEASLFETH